MPVIGLSLKSIEGKREANASGEIKVDSIPKILDIKEINVPGVDKKALSVDFEFSTRYEPKIGDLKVGGQLLYVGEAMGDVLKQWKEEKKVPEEASLEILNHIFRKCLVKSSSIADDLQLPPPLAMPVLRPKKAEDGKEAKKE